MLNTKRASYLGSSVVISIIAFIVALIAFIVALPTLLFSGISSEVIVNYLRIFVSAIALVLSIILIRKNPNKIVYNILAIAIGCIFLNDSYNFIHQLFFGDTERYIINYLPYLGSIAFITSINIQFMKKENNKHKYIPLLAIIPAIFLGFLIWLLIGKVYIFPSLYTILLSISFYTITAMFLTKRRKYIFFEIVFLIHGLSAFFIIGNFTEYTGTLIVAIIELIVTLVPLIYIPAIKMGVKECQQS